MSRALIEVHNKATGERVSFDPASVILVAEQMNQTVIPYRDNGTLILLNGGSQQVSAKEPYDKVLALLERAEQEVQP